MTWHIYADQATSDDRSSDAGATQVGAAVFRIANFPSDPGDFALEVFERDSSLAAWDRVHAETGEDVRIATIAGRIEGEGDEQRLVLEDGPAAVRDNDLSGADDSGLTLSLVLQVGDADHAYELKVPSSALAGEDGWVEVGVRAPGQTWSETEDPLGNVPVLLPLPYYGGHDLRHGDADGTSTYGGERRAAPARLPREGEVGFVRQLQQDLTELGFGGLVGAPDGGFGRGTQMAVRELQVYAKMPKLARQAEGEAPARYVDSLTAVENEEPYEGPVSGVVNGATRTLIQRWRRLRLRCPVVMERWRVRDRRADDGALVFEREGTAPVEQNLWRHSEGHGAHTAVFARDLSGYWDALLPAAHPAGDLHVVGEHKSWRTYGGPLSSPSKGTWPEGEATPETFVGASWDALASVPGARSTFKVVRAVGEKEFIGFADCINAYDNAIVSLGPCHWTLGIVGRSGAVSRGELGGYLALLAESDPETFHTAFGAFGARPDRAWRGNGRLLFNQASCKYSAGVEVEDEPAAGLAGGHASHLFAAVATDTDAEINWFKSWHWIHRLAMAGRLLPGWTRAMWTMARVRLRDILATRGVRHAGSTFRVGELFTSELAVAILLRWHIRMPGHVISSGPGLVIDRVMSAVPRSSWPADPTQWGDEQQGALIDALIHEAATGTYTNSQGHEVQHAVHTSVPALRTWARGGPAPARPSGDGRFRWRPATQVTLSRAARSFVLDERGLPAAPYDGAGELLPAGPEADAAPADEPEHEPRVDEPDPDEPTPEPPAAATSEPATSEVPPPAPATSDAPTAEADPAPAGDDTASARTTVASFPWTDIAIIGDSQGGGFRGAWRRAGRPGHRRGFSITAIGSQRTTFFLENYGTRQVPRPAGKRLVMLLLGGNDITGSARSAAQIQETYEDLVERVRVDAASDATIVLATIPVRGPWFDEAASRADRETVMNDVNAWILAGPAGTRPFDVNAVVSDPADPRMVRAEYAQWRSRHRYNVHFLPAGYDAVLADFQARFVAP